MTGHREAGTRQVTTTLAGPCHRVLVRRCTCADSVRAKRIARARWRVVIDAGVAAVTTVTRAPSGMARDLPETGRQAPPEYA